MKFSKYGIWVLFGGGIIGSLGLARIGQVISQNKIGENIDLVQKLPSSVIGLSIAGIYAINLVLAWTLVKKIETKNA